MSKFLFFVFVTFLASQSFADPYGMYAGVIRMSPDPDRGIPNGRNVPITISLKQTDTEQPPVNPTNVFFGVKKVDGSFVLDSECGPFGFFSSEYDLESGKLILQYARLGSTGSASSIINLRIQCTRLADGTCNGTVSGVSAAVGTISLKQISTQVSPLPVVPKYVGMWKGIITYDPTEIVRRTKKDRPVPPPSEEFILFLGRGNGTVTNPDFYEIASTPLKTGSDYEGGKIGQAIPYAISYIDYLRGIGEFTANSISPQYAGSETVIAYFQDDNSILGTVATTKGPMGTFVAKKVQ